MVEPLLPEAYTKLEMIDNPLYDFTKSKDKREQELIKMARKELPAIPDQNIPSPKSQESDGKTYANKQPSSSPFVVPTPRFRSYTCSNQSGEKSALMEKIHGKQKLCANIDTPMPIKKPVKLSRSEVGLGKPPVPSKSQVVLDMQTTKERDYRESSEFPHHRKHTNDDEMASRTIVPVGCFFGHQLQANMMESNIEV